MKALIISDDENVYSQLNFSLQSKGFDTIIYKWLLKALDNIEEIRPNIIIVSSSEYPRHWKTLVQFVKSGIGGDEVKIYLYEPKPLSKEDEEKAKILGITDYFTDLSEHTLSKIFESKVEEKTEINPTEEENNDEFFSVDTIINSEKPDESSTQNAITSTGHFIFTHPVSKKIISGKYFDYNGCTMSCKCYDTADNASCFKDTVIDYFTFFDSNKTKKAKAVVKDFVMISDDNIFVVIEIKDIYEEK